MPGSLLVLAIELGLAVLQHPPQVGPVDGAGGVAGVGELGYDRRAELGGLAVVGFMLSGMEKPSPHPPLEACSSVETRWYVTAMTCSRP